MARSAGGGVEFTVSGAKEIERAFRLLPKKAAGKVVRQAARKALKPMLAETKRQAPVSDPVARAQEQARDSRGRFTSVMLAAAGGHAPGLLKRSIKLRARLKRKRGEIAFDVRVGDGDFRGETFYAAMVNFGTQYQEGQNYMERAFDATKNQVSRTVVQMVSAGVLREWEAL